MDSADTAHVPPPDPRNFWPLEIGKQQTISIEPFIAIELLKIETQQVRIQMTMPSLLNHPLIDYLNLDKPVVVLRRFAWVDAEPMLTFTLRKIEGQKAFLQITYNPKSGTAMPVQ
jgi:hypothetical protein